MTTATALVFAVVVLIALLALGATASFLFFGILAYLEAYQDMPHGKAQDEHPQSARRQRR